MSDKTPKTVNIGGKEISTGKGFVMIGVLVIFIFFLAHLFAGGSSTPASACSIVQDTCTGCVHSGPTSAYLNGKSTRVADIYSCTTTNESIVTTFDDKKLLVGS